VPTSSLGHRLAAPADRGEELAEVMAARDGRPMLMIDLAVPRDIDAACGELDGVSLYDIDDLQASSPQPLACARSEARKAEGIVEEEIQHFATWLGSLEVLPTLAALRAQRDRDRRAGGRRERRQVGVGLVRARPRAGRRARARDRQPAAAPADGCG
jgi:glutamyl-tRNA reductase